jgi:hypothetical protein
MHFIEEEDICMGSPLFDYGVIIPPLSPEAGLL